MHSFQRSYDVKVDISTFNTIDEAVAKLASGAVQFDVFVPETVFLEQLVVGRILQPLNHSYIPNLAANVWPALADPGMTSAAATRSPTRSDTTGIGWRADHLPGFDPANYRPRGRRCGRGGFAARSGCSTTSTTV